MVSVLAPDGFVVFPVLRVWRKFDLANLSVASQRTDLPVNSGRTRQRSVKDRDTFDSSATGLEEARLKIEAIEGERLQLDLGAKASGVRGEPACGLFIRLRPGAMDPLPIVLLDQLRGASLRLIGSSCRAHRRDTKPSKKLFSCQSNRHRLFYLIREQPRG